MNRLLRLLLALGWWAACAGAPATGAPAASAPGAGAPPPVVTLRIDGAIGPVAARQVGRALERAAQEKAQLVVLQMDTPGGLDSAMRSIVKDILASPVPVAGFVAPQGARAASAGTYILYAAHVAAMAPATNLGAATPVALGMPGAPPEQAPASAASGAAPPDAMGAKRVHDASAYIRGLAQLRGRDAAWAEQAVREAVSLSAREALARRVIDLVASDLDDLLRQLDGRVLRLAGEGGPQVKLATAQARVVALEMDTRGRLLAAISDPSLVLLLLMIGVYGLLFEFMNPGFVAPGVIGAVALLVALWGLQMLPVNYAGLGLILLGIAFLVMEAFVPSYGALGLGGVVALGFGALLLVDEVPGVAVSRAWVLGLTLALAAGVLALAGMAAKSRRRPVVSGAPHMIGATGTVLEFDGSRGWASVQGERWQVHCERPLPPGQPVRVVRVDGLTLDVRAIDEPPQGAS